MLIDDKSRVVKLFVDNLLWGKISTSFFNNTNSEYVDQVYENVQSWIKLQNQDQKDLTPDDYMVLDYTEDYLYEVFLRGRVDGTIKGLLKDEAYEQQIKRLEHEKNQLTREYNQLNLRYLQINADNQKLAEQLHDRESIIASFENGLYKK